MYINLLKLKIWLASRTCGQPRDYVEVYDIVGSKARYMLLGSIRELASRLTIAVQPGMDGIIRLFQQSCHLYNCNVLLKDNTKQPCPPTPSQQDSAGPF